MAKYFIDCEFIEGFHKPLFRKKRHFIDLISIGIVCEDGREYYAISNEYDYKKADKWVQENVILPMYIQEVHGDARNHLDVSNFHKYILNSKSNKQIAEEVFQFCTDDVLTIEKAKYYNVVKEGIEFYGYYADYDWVLFCSLFGRMIDLPKGFPMYCRDLKQTLDLYASKAGISPGAVKYLDDYPNQENEHNALTDAKWNKELYEFLTNLC
jgi:hypothetical protein